MEFFIWGEDRGGFFRCRRERLRVAYAGYGSAGGQPERHVLPEGLQAPDRAEAILRHGLFLGVKSLLAQRGKLRGFGGRAPKEEIVLFRSGFDRPWCWAMKKTAIP